MKTFAVCTLPSKLVRTGEGLFSCRRRLLYLSTLTECVSVFISFRSDPHLLPPKVALVREPPLAGDLNERHDIWERRREEGGGAMGSRNHDKASSFMVGLIKQ